MNSDEDNVYRIHITYDTPIRVFYGQKGFWRLKENDAEGWVELTLEPFLKKEKPGGQ